MQHGNDFESHLWKALRMQGYDLPLSEDEIAAFESALKKYKIPEMPEGLSDPMNILERGIMQHTELENVVFDGNNEILQNLAMAAREGKNISEDVRRQMLNDRKDSEENKQK